MRHDIETPELDAPLSMLREAVVDGLMIETQVVPMDRATAERVADRIMEAVERRDLTVLDPHEGRRVASRG